MRTAGLMTSLMVMLGSLSGAASVASAPSAAASEQLGKPATPIAKPLFRDPTGIAVMFEDVASAATYTAKVYRDGVLLRTVSPFSSGDRITGLAARTDYTVTVTANSIGAFAASPESDPVSVTTSASALTVSTPTANLGWRVDVANSLQIATGGGDGQLTFSVFSGQLPPGVTLSQVTGVLSGTATRSGSYPLIVTVSDSRGQTARTSSFTIRVVGASQRSVRWQGVGGTYAVASQAPAGTVVGAVRALDEVSGSTLVYSLEPGSDEGFIINESTGAISTSATMSAPVGTTYSLVVGATNGTNPKETASFVVLVTDAAPGVKTETFTGMTRLPSRADASGTSAVAQQVYLPSQDRGSNYAMRYTGFIVAPDSNYYTFYLSSDDASQFRISPTASSSALPEKSQASVSGWSAPLTWNASTQVTTPLYLIRGQMYAFEVLFREVGGADHLALAWRAAGDPAPTNGSAAALVPASAFLQPTVIPDTVAPTTPRNLAATTVTADAVTLNWYASQDATGVDHYDVLRGQTVIATIPAQAGMLTHVDFVSSGVHDYSVVAVDAAGNSSLPAVIRGIAAGTAWTPVEEAMRTGDARVLTDPRVLMRAIGAEHDVVQARAAAVLEAFYPANTAVGYTAHSYDATWAPKTAYADRVFPLLTADLCGTASCSKSLGVAGVTGKGTRFAAFGARDLLQTGTATGDIRTGLARLVRWMITGSPTGGTMGSKFAVLTQTGEAIKTWLVSEGIAAGGDVTVCGAADTACLSAMASADFIVSGTAAANLNSSAVLDALRLADSQGRPFLAIDDSRSYEPLAFTTALANEFDLLRNTNYWTRGSVSIPAANAASRRSSALLYIMLPVADLKVVVDRMLNDDWPVSLRDCAGVECPGSAGGFLLTDFYPGAADFVRSGLTDLANNGVELFETPTNDLRSMKLAVLLGDVLRRQIEYPIDKMDASEFFKAFFADHAVYTVRDRGEAQPDLRGFTATDPSPAPRISKSVDYTARVGSYVASATVYGIPGEPITISRTDSQVNTTVKVTFTTLRSGSTRQFDAGAYDRPKFLQSAWVSIPAGGSVTLVSPYGGPMAVWVSGSESPFPVVSLTFDNVVQHPVWNGDETTAQFESLLESGLFDWAEILTSGFEIHSRADLVKLSITDPDYSSLSLLAKGAYEDFYLANYNLAGFVGPGLTRNTTVTALCQAMSLNCEERARHGIPSMNHFNADRATCGFGCSGNPYDAFWPFGPLSWGDNHEMGHNIQSLHVANLAGKIQTGEVSNNIFPMHTVYTWNSKHPDRLRGTTHEIDQQALFSLFVQAAQAADPKRAAYDRIWGSAADPNVTFTRNGQSVTRANSLNSVQVAFYTQLVALARSQFTPRSADTPFGDGGWDLITILHVLDRLQGYFASDATRWAGWKDAHGYSTYTSSEAASIPANDRLLVHTSFALQLDMRPFFDMWGIYYTTKASAQVALGGYVQAPKRFFYWSVDGNGNDGTAVPTAMWTTDSIGSAEVTANAPLIPDVSMHYLTTEGNVDEVEVKKPIKLTVQVAGPGSVTISEAGVPIPGCANLTPERWVRPTGTYATWWTTFTASCVWSPQTAGTRSLTSTFSATGSVLTSPAPQTISVNVTGSAEAPVITALSSSLAEEGALITVSGTNLDAINGAVFNGYRASILPGSATSLRVRVPSIANPALVRGAFEFETTSGHAVSSPAFEVIKRVASVDITAGTLFAARGQVLPLTAVVAPAYATDKAVLWTSADSAVASVDPSGRLVARAAGTTTVRATARDGGAFDTVTVVVREEPPLRSVGARITSSISTLRLGSATPLTAQLTPSGADATIDWSTSDPSILSIDSGGSATAVAYGSATLTATPSDGGAPDAVTVTVVPDVAVDDAADQVVGVTTGLEWSLDNGGSWTAFSSSVPSVSQLSGNRRLLVRPVGRAASVAALVFTDANAATNPLTTVIPGVTYISDLPLASGSSVGYGAWGRDVSTSVRQMKLKGVTYARGLAGHAVSTANLALAGRYARFVADAGVDQAVSGGSVVFVVLRDGVEAYRSGTLTAASTPARIDLDVTGVTTLTLVAENANGSNSQDHSQWAGAYLTPAVTAVTPAASRLSLAPGQTSSVAASVTAVSGAPATVTAVSYQSADPRAATVDASGTVTAVAEGSTVITVTANEGRTRVNVPVRVATPGVTSLATPSSATVVGGKRTGIAAVATSDPGVTPILQWSSSDPTIATVNAAGVVTGVAPGSAVITVATRDGRFQSMTTVTVSAPDQATPVIIAQPQATSTLVGSPIALSVRATVADGGVLSYVWSKDGVPVPGAHGPDLTIASARLGDAGTYSVTVTSTLGSKVVDVTSEEVLVAVTQPVTGVRLDRTAATLTIGGGSLTLEATVLPADASNKSLTWSSSQPEIARVTAGIVEALAPGTAVITATSQDGAFTAQATITVQLPAAGAPRITTQPAGASRRAGQSATFTVIAASDDGGTLSYQWRRNGAAITDAAGSVSGATTPALTLSGLTVAASGDYTVEVTNTRNGTTARAVSTTAMLTVTLQDQAAVRVTNTTLSGLLAGRTVTLTAAGGSGTGALSYSVTGSGCSITGASLLMRAAGTCRVTAQRAASGVFAVGLSAPVDFVFVAAAQPRLSIANAARTGLARARPVVLVTSGGAGSGAVTFRVTSGRCTVAGASLRAPSAGSCTVVATKAASEGYLAATSAPVTFTFR